MKDYRYIIGHHLPVFLLTGMILSASLFFRVDHFPLNLCLFKRFTGYPCPTCGFTRAFCDFARGNWAGGFLECPFALILFAGTILLFLYSALTMALGLLGIRVQRGNYLQFTSKKIIITVSVLSALLVANWIYRLMMGLK